ncbi:MAG: sigma-70 family RNA polymerase sigma factor [Oscillospiraceae bacterium]|nr:sigma-70 family RNA polymerase sigma factor [Oscillospiraceae bacterium]
MAMTQQETDLVISAQSGDTDSFEMLYDIFCDKVYAFARMIMRNASDAEDVLQEAFITAWQKLETLKTPATFSVWIQVIAKNLCNMQLRKKNVAILLDAEQEVESLSSMESDELLPAAYAEREDLKERLGMIIESLSEVQRQAIVLYYFNEMSVDEIAEVMECSANTVKTRLFLARKAIKSEIEEQERKSGEKLYGVTGILMLSFGVVFKSHIETLSLGQSVIEGTKGAITQFISSGNGATSGSTAAGGNGATSGSTAASGNSAASGSTATSGSTAAGGNSATSGNTAANGSSAVGGTSATSLSASSAPSIPLETSKTNVTGEAKKTTSPKLKIAAWVSIIAVVGTVAVLLIVFFSNMNQGDVLDNDDDISSVDDTVIMERAINIDIDQEEETDISAPGEEPYTDDIDDDIEQINPIESIDEHEENYLGDNNSTIDSQEEDIVDNDTISDEDIISSPAPSPLDSLLPVIQPDEAPSTETIQTDDSSIDTIIDTIPSDAPTTEGVASDDDATDESESDETQTDSQHQRVVESDAPTDDNEATDINQDFIPHMEIATTTPAPFGIIQSEITVVNPRGTDDSAEASPTTPQNDRIPFEIPRNFEVRETPRIPRERDIPAPIPTTVVPDDSIDNGLSGSIANLPRSDALDIIWDRLRGYWTATDNQFVGFTYSGGTFAIDFGYLQTEWFNRGTLVNAVATDTYKATISIYVPAVAATAVAEAREEMWVDVYLDVSDLHVDGKIKIKIDTQGNGGWYQYGWNSYTL